MISLFAKKPCVMQLREIIRLLSHEISNYLLENSKLGAINFANIDISEIYRTGFLFINY